MRRYLGVVVGAVVLLAAGVGLVRRQADRAKQAERQLARVRIDQDFLERMATVRAQVDPKAYRDDLAAVFKAHFAAIDELRERHGDGTEAEGGPTLEGKPRSGKGDKSDAAKAGRKAMVDEVSGIAERMRNGRYAPVWSGTDKGIHLDVVSDDPRMVEGRPVIRYQIAVFGAPRQLRDEGPKGKRIAADLAFEVKWKLLDQKDKPIGEMTASGDPSTKVDWPEHVVPDFPPQVVVGHYDVDLFPAEVAKVEIAFTLSSHSPSGAPIKAEYSWKTEAPSEWKLRSGEKWEGAVESTAPVEP